MTAPLSKSARKVADCLVQMGFDCRVLELAASTRTSAEAAAAVGCEVGQIAKSIVLKGKKSGSPLLVIASGKNRINIKMTAAITGESMSMAEPDFVREKTGYAIGGIPPLGHTEKLATIIDQELMTYDVIWAAAGTPNALFKLTPAQLVAMTDGRVKTIC